MSTLSADNLTSKNNTCNAAPTIGQTSAPSSACQFPDAKTYCMEVLQNVRAINSHDDLRNPQSFSTILTTIGFLSSLCCEQDDKHGDKAKFVCFMRRWMPAQYHGIAKDLYGVVRCGLVHAMSISSKPSQKAFAMTHDAATNTHLTVDNSKGTARIVLVASCMCDDIEQAITNMFADAGTKTTIEANFRKAPPITAYEVS